VPPSATPLDFGLGLILRTTAWWNPLLRQEPALGFYPKVLIVAYRLAGQSTPLGATPVA